jgi:hypothetical protein
LGLIDGAAAIYAPTLTPKNTISLGLLDGVAAIYAPTVANASGLQTIVLSLLDGGAVLYALAVATVGDVQPPPRGSGIVDVTPAPPGRRQRRLRPSIWAKDDEEILLLLS